MPLHVKLYLMGSSPAGHRAIGQMLLRAGAVETADESKADVRIGIWQLGMPVPVDGTCPLVRWWTGTDVLCLEDGRTQDTVKHNWVAAPWFRSRLEACGLKASVIPIIPACKTVALPLPATPAIYAYAPDRPVYRWGDVTWLANMLPHVKFYVTGRNASSLDPPNVEALGGIHCDRMHEVYAKVSIVLRLCDTDGLSLTILEALSYGRYAVWKGGNIPGCRTVANKEEALYALHFLLGAQQANLTGLETMERLGRAVIPVLARELGHFCKTDRKEGTA